MNRRKQIWPGGLRGDADFTDDGRVLAKQIHAAISKLVADALSDGYSLREITHLIIHEVYVVESLHALGARAKHLSKTMECGRRSKKRRPQENR